MKNNAKQGALRFIVLLGIVSLCADVVYEGARSISGPFLFSLGASSVVVGWVAGLGEFIGYSLRLASGYLADRLKSYWVFTIAGYSLSVLSVPLLALAGRWDIAALLIIFERLGKAVRTPSRDVMLSYATYEVGRGRGFGIHEALDQIGAIFGPLLIALTLFLTKSYRPGFAILIIPAVLALIALTVARVKFPNPSILEAHQDEPSEKNKKKNSPRAQLNNYSVKNIPSGFIFLLYTIFIMLSTFGFAHFQLISYHFKIKAIVPDVQIPLFFALAMAADALVALVVGRVYDRLGLGVLISIPLLIIPLSFFVFSNSYFAVLIGIALWGMNMGVQETIMRASIADITPQDKRGLAYGIFNTAYGFAWFLGNGLMGVLYSISINYLIAFAVAMQILCLPFCVACVRIKDKKWRVQAHGIHPQLSRLGFLSNKDFKFLKVLRFKFLKKTAGFFKKHHKRKSVAKKQAVASTTRDDLNPRIDNHTTCYEPSKILNTRNSLFWAWRRVKEYHRDFLVKEDDGEAKEVYALMHS